MFAGLGIKFISVQLLLHSDRLWFVECARVPKQKDVGVAALQPVSSRNEKECLAEGL